MARKSRYNVTLEMLETVCTLCQYRIHPRDLLRTGEHTIRCPQCGEDFVPEAKGNWTQLHNDKRVN
jgi:predicted RNA-binding Zn-ribbon protein involved in translation (DUF1610 family)